MARSRHALVLAAAAGMLVAVGLLGQRGAQVPGAPPVQVEREAVEQTSLGSPAPAALVPSARSPASPEAAPTTPTRFTARARLGGGLLGWDAGIVSRSLWTALGNDLRRAEDPEPHVAVGEDGIAVSNGLFAYALSWEDVDLVYAPPTNDVDNPQVLCISTRDGGLVVLSELALGNATEAVVEEVARRHPEHALLMPEPP